MRKPRQWQWVKHKTAKQCFAVCRLLHVYLSTLLFGLIIFFSITGLYLNHLEWFDREEKTGNQGMLTYTLSDSVLAGLKQKPSDMRPLLQFIARETGADQVQKIQWEEAELTLDYPMPAGYLYAIVDMESGMLELDYQQGHWLLVLNDLHKGRHSGEAWSWVIDITAIFSVVFSLTGLFILLQKPKHRRGGLVAMFLGVLTPCVIYLIYVPYLYSLAPS